MLRCPAAFIHFQPVFPDVLEAVLYPSGGGLFLFSGNVWVTIGPE